MSGPHDLFVRLTFGNPEHAAAELRAVLPAELVSQVDWSSLRREPGSVIDPELRETESDLLFSAHLRGRGALLFYVLIEHQSSGDGWMALWMLRYVVRQLERWRQEHPDRTRLPLVRLAWRVLRYGRTNELAKQLPGWKALFARVHAAPHGFQELGAVVHSLWLVGDEAVKVATDDVLHSVVGAQQAEELMMTWGERLIEQGRQQGRQEGWDQGRAKGRAEAVLRVLVARGVQVDEVARQRILSCTDLVTLDQWFDRALAATRLSDVLES